jgi:hypothetical protein
VSVFVLVLDSSKVRWTQEQVEVMQVFDNVFSSKEESFLEHTIILFNKAKPKFFTTKKTEHRIQKAGEEWNLIDNIPNSICIINSTLS